MDMMLAGRFFAGGFTIFGRGLDTHALWIGFGVGIMSDLAPLYQVFMTLAT